MLGERLYPLVADLQPDRAAKITGMLLEMDNAEILLLIENPTALQTKVDEAVTVSGRNMLFSISPRCHTAQKTYKLSHASFWCWMESFSKLLIATSKIQMLFDVE